MPAGLLSIFRRPGFVSVPAWRPASMQQRHEAALAHRGSTIAVVGTGVDIVYPARHMNLEKFIADKGCVISEYSLGTPAIAGNFPRRNRLISGLSAGVLVVEAAAQSGFT